MKSLKCSEKKKDIWTFYDNCDNSHLLKIMMYYDPLTEPQVEIVLSAIIRGILKVSVHMQGLHVFMCTCEFTWFLHDITWGLVQHPVFSAQGVL